MRTNIVSIGNSQGIRIPKILLEESGLGKEVELKVEKGEIRIVPAQSKAVNDTALMSEKALVADWGRSAENVYSHTGKPKKRLTRAKYREKLLSIKGVWINEEEIKRNRQQVEKRLKRYEL